MAQPNVARDAFFMAGTRRFFESKMHAILSFIELQKNSLHDAEIDAWCRVSATASDLDVC